MRFSRSQATTQLPIVSNQSMVYLTIDLMDKKRRKTFRFEEISMEDPECEEVNYFDMGELR